MSNKWQRYEPQVRYGGLYVSLNARGEIVLNKSSWGALRKAGGVCLLWDPQAKRLGVKEAIFGDGREFIIRDFGRGGRSKVARCAAALKGFGIEVERTIRFHDVEVTSMGDRRMLVLDFAQTTASTRKTSSSQNKPEG